VSAPLRKPARDNEAMRALLSERHQGHSRGRRLLLLLTPAAAFLALLGFGMLRTSGPPQPGEPAPEFSAPVLGRPSTASLSDYRGRPLLLNFWASWCVPCEEEAGALARAHRLYGKEVAFLGVDVRDARDDALAFVERHDVPYPSVRDETRSIYDAYGLTGQPETFFIDQNGVVVEHVNGPFLQDGDLFARLDVLVRRNG
jgi:cytochrome c biogenesis protein CcmG, thiol:disulfide interchange protein DsbE